MTPGIRYLDGPRLARGLRGGVARLIDQREAINRINVYPVPDGDTGTNMAHTARTVANRIAEEVPRSAGVLLARVADAAIDGARGNSGAILAAFLQGLADAAEHEDRLTCGEFARAAQRAADAARLALDDPREGTMLTVMTVWAGALNDSDSDDVEVALAKALDVAERALIATTAQLAVLRDADVVDAGALGFVDWLRGIGEFIAEGAMGDMAAVSRPLEDQMESPAAHAPDDDRFRFCTECVISGDAIDRVALRESLVHLGGASLVIAGSKRKARVHMHVDNPARLFLACERFGAVSSRKADDMRLQSASREGSNRIAVMTDSAADLPEEEEERLGIYIVPLRIHLGDRQHLDRVSLTPEEFYAALRTSPGGASTSQPPPGDFRRQFEFLLTHHPGVVSVNASSQLSGTWQAAKSTADRVGGNIAVVDALNVAAGEGLLAMYAAEAAGTGCDVPQVVALLEGLRSQTHTWGVVKDLSYGVKGGRIPAWIKRAADWLHVSPVLASTASGTVKMRGAIWGKRQLAQRFARYVRRRLDANTSWRLMIAHGDWPDGGKILHDTLVAALPHVHSSFITAAGTAFGVHAGPGSLVVGAHPYQAPQP